MTISLYAALLALMLIALSINVIKNRRRIGVALGDDNNHEMRRHIRAHGNFIEYTPLFLLMLALAEYNGLSVYAIHAFGLLFLAGRLSHAYGLIRGEKYEDGKLQDGVRYRVRGMIATFASLGLLSALLLFEYAVSLTGL